MTQVVIAFRKSVLPFVRNARYYYGFVSEEDLGERLRMTFLIHSEASFCRWLVSFGNAAEIESPASLKEAMAALVEELALHYKELEVKA